ncbi:hypothetical protein Pmani_025654 [Petrolisthes manimaculis]|uniref:Uncharacterized protein n=1 Tax=Petrolisthes manimaculis TaxID=1843537 RepID=A0AAE1P7F2_9EUCA|nr:hypothetical protein Pmani_025654 [Petrolisthes manimaculis]
MHPPSSFVFTHHHQQQQQQHHQHHHHHHHHHHLAPPSRYLSTIGSVKPLSSVTLTTRNATQEDCRYYVRIPFRTVVAYVKLSDVILTMSLLTRRHYSHDATNHTTPLLTRRHYSHDATTHTTPLLTRHPCLNDASTRTYSYSFYKQILLFNSIATIQYMSVVGAPSHG